MFKRTVLCIGALLYLGCDSGPSPSTRFDDVDYTISASDSIDIAELTSHFTNALIDTISVDIGIHCGVCDPRGFAKFETQSADSDHIVRSVLQFCSDNWPVCTTGFEDASGRVDVNGWISAPAYFHSETLMVVQFRDMELEFPVSTTTGKDTIIHYLSMIADSQYAVACSSCLAPDVRSINSFSTRVSADTLLVTASRFGACGGVSSVFGDVAGRLTLLRNAYLVCRSLAP